MKPTTQAISNNDNTTTKEQSAPAKHYKTAPLSASLSRRSISSAANSNNK